MRTAQLIFSFWPSIVLQSCPLVKYHRAPFWGADVSQKTSWSHLCTSGTTASFVNVSLGCSGCSRLKLVGNPCTWLQKSVQSHRPQTGPLLCSQLVGGAINVVTPNLAQQPLASDPFAHPGWLDNRKMLLGRDLVNLRAMVKACKKRLQLSSLQRLSKSLNPIVNWARTFSSPC